MIGAVVLLIAQLHSATPFEELHRCTTFTSEIPAAPADFRASAAKVFNVTAKRFEFEFNPELVIDQGDSVTLNITAADVPHGFALEVYMGGGVTVEPGRPVSINFVAHTPGTFTYFCNFFCGDGHGNMFGRLTVNAVVAAAPSISSFTPPNAPTTGGTVVLISGSDFQNDSVVRFGSVNALSTIFNSSSSLTAFTPAHAAGAVPITVINPDGQSATSATNFTFGNPQPVPKRRRAVRR
jgi:plastocyanin